MYCKYKNLISVKKNSYKDLQTKSKMSEDEAKFEWNPESEANLALNIRKWKKMSQNEAIYHCYVISTSKMLTKNIDISVTSSGGKRWEGLWYSFKTVLCIFLIILYCFIIFSYFFVKWNRFLLDNMRDFN